MIKCYENVGTLSSVIPSIRISFQKIDTGPEHFSSSLAKRIAYQRAKTLAKLNGEAWDFERTGPVGAVYIEMFKSRPEVAYIDKIVEMQKKGIKDPFSLEGGARGLLDPFSRRLIKSDPKVGRLIKRKPVSVNSSTLMDMDAPVHKPQLASLAESSQTRQRSSSVSTDELWEEIWKDDPLHTGLEKPPNSGDKAWNNDTQHQQPRYQKPTSLMSDVRATYPRSRADGGTSREPGSALYSALLHAVSEEPQNTSLNYMMRRWQEAQSEEAGTSERPAREYPTNEEPTREYPTNEEPTHWEPINQGQTLEEQGRRANGALESAMHKIRERLRLLREQRKGWEE
jgi:hypothetical protein